MVNSRVISHCKITLEISGNVSVVKKCTRLTMRLTMKRPIYMQSNYNKN